MHAILKPFVESSFAFGASRWISTLQRQAERFIYSTGINISPSDAPISPEGRRSLTMTANKMVVSFCNDICNSTYHHWTSSNKTRLKTMEVKTNKRRGDPGKPPGLHRTAGCTIELLSSHNSDRHPGWPGEDGLQCRRAKTMQQLNMDKGNKNKKYICL